MHVVNVFWRLAGSAVLMWMVVIGLAGCGPGVGGSGTGEESVQALAAFDAKAAAVCGTALASSLQCPASGSTATAADTPAATFTDRATGGQVIATLQGDALDLEARCRHLRFSGVWGIDRSGQARFYGFAVNDATGERVPAQVVMVAVPGGVQVTLLDADGRDMLGAVEMVPGTGAGGRVPVCS